MYPGNDTVLSQSQEDNHIQWIAWMIWIPKALSHYIRLYSFGSLLCIRKSSQNLGLHFALESSNPAPTLTWSTNRAPHLFKQQPSQGQLCEMVTTSVNKDSLSHLSSAPHIFLYDGIYQHQQPALFELLQKTGKLHRAWMCVYRVWELGTFACCMHICMSHFLILHFDCFY